ncbi:MAG: hypothetical protein WAX14_12480 [Rhodococcus sp. (in: high G+C Gram-positive bacteria)]|uniref:hypothetical protein n=1 Tax=Rhodococcus sp. TaxID=1831 RepID=UPI003BB5E3C5
MAEPTNNATNDPRPTQERTHGAAAPTPDRRTEPRTATEPFTLRRTPKKKALSTYITVATSARLAEATRSSGLSTTDVVEAALVRVFDELGIPPADVDGNLTTD